VVAESLESRLQASVTRYEALAAALAGVGVIASGSLALRSHRCGKPNCACMADPPRPHGPYWHLTTKVAGRTVNRRLSEDEARAYSEWIANDRHMRALIDELRGAAQEVIELTLASKRSGSRV
jgi:hypothetical protein